MKLKHFLPVLFLILNVHCYSQTFAGFGIKGGLVLASHTFAEAGSTYSRTGFEAGVLGEFFKLKLFSLITEVNFEQKGGNDRFESIDHYLTVYVLSIPMLAKLTSFTGKFLPYLSVGPRIDVYIGNDKTEPDKYYYQDINPVDFGITAAIGSEIQISKKISLLAETSWSPDLTTYRSPTVTHDLIIRNISFEFRTGIKFSP